MSKEDLRSKLDFLNRFHDADKNIFSSDDPQIQYLETLTANLFSRLDALPDGNITDRGIKNHMMISVSEVVMRQVGKPDFFKSHGNLMNQMEYDKYLSYGFDIQAAKSIILSGLISEWSDRNPGPVGKSHPVFKLLVMAETYSYNSRSNHVVKNRIDRLLRNLCADHEIEFFKIQNSNLDFFPHVENVLAEDPEPVTIFRRIKDKLSLKKKDKALSGQIPMPVVPEQVENIPEVSKPVERLPRSGNIFRRLFPVFNNGAEA